MKRSLALVIRAVLIATAATAVASPSLPGNWRGNITVNGHTISESFDIYNAPCRWGQPTETPYLAQEQNGNVAIIQTAASPDGSAALDLFSWKYDGKTYRLYVQDWSSNEIKGVTFEAGKEQVGEFSFRKAAVTGLFDHCFHRDRALLSLGEQNTEIVVFSLRFPRLKQAFCCSGGVFGACELGPDHCAFSTMTSDYRIVDLEGQYENPTHCSGNAFSSQPPHEGVGSFSFQDISSCRKERYPDAN